MLKSLSCVQLAASAGKKVVGALASLDVKLEEVGVLPKLTPQPVPEDVADEDGQMHNDRMEVRPGYGSIHTGLKCTLHVNRQQVHDAG